MLARAQRRDHLIGVLGDRRGEYDRLDVRLEQLVKRIIDGGHMILPREFFRLRPVDVADRDQLEAVRKVQDVSGQNPASIKADDRCFNAFHAVLPPAYRSNFDR